MDFERARHWMVKAQVRVNDVTDPGIQAAMRRLPRERFAPARPDIAYSDNELEVAPGRVLMRPRDAAKLIQLLSPRPGERALEIAGATGYGAAVLAEIGCKTVALESDPGLIQAAQAAMMACGLSDVLAASGDLAVGFADRAPYNLILVSAGAEIVPQAWLDQLDEGGRLAVIVRSGPAGAARLYTKAGGAVAYRTAFDAAPPVAPALMALRTFTF
jgi:protein-L-isoaspartate(D-aspartate) O-methyltransferase